MFVLKDLLKRYKKNVRKSILKELLKYPDKFSYTLEVVDEEIVIKIKRKEEAD